MKRAVLAILFTLVGSSLKAEFHQPLPRPLRLPPGLVQVLPVNKTASYYGDAVRIVDCRDDKDSSLGTCGNLLFGGLAMTDSHLSGLILIQFFTPVNNIAHFEISLPQNLRGDDAVMKAPQFYEMPVRDSFVLDPLGQVSSGDLNLITGEVRNLDVPVILFNTFVQAFGRANPNIKASVIRFPGPYGSARAVFEQRPDGLLDFTFHGSTFIPLGNNFGGDPVRVPLPFCGPLLQCGSIVALGTALHPHLHISTKEPDGPECGDKCPDIPLNSIQQYTVFARHSTIGDRVEVNIPQLGGPSSGRSGIQGRLQIQFGGRTGDTVPFSLSLLLPSGLLAKPPDSPLALPGVSPGMIGHDFDLRFPRLTYRIKNVAGADDPFDLAVGAINLKTGKVIGNLLYRGFVLQSLALAIFEQNAGALVPASFQFRGPASFEKGTNGQTVFRFDGRQTIKFENIVWPTPDFNRANSFVTGLGSVVNPRLILEAMQPADLRRALKSGGANNVVSNVGDTFSYNYSIPCDPVGQTASFQYANNNASTGGTFRMESLASANCLNSPTSRLSPGDYDTVTFTGYGTWSKDENVHLATVQISTSPDFPYVTILIDGGQTSQANTKPPDPPLP